MKQRKLPCWTDVVFEFRYDDETGELFWKNPRQGRNLKKPAGHVSKLSGYRIIAFDGMQLNAHDLVWLRHNIEPPVGFVRHLNGRRTDNRIKNLYDDGVSDFI